MCHIASASFYYYIYINLLLSWWLIYIFYIYLRVYGQIEISVLWFTCDFVCNSSCYTPCTASLQLCMCHINLFIYKKLLYLWLTTHISVLFIYHVTSTQLTELAYSHCYMMVTQTRFIEANRFPFSRIAYHCVTVYPNTSPSPISTLW